MLQGREANLIFLVVGRVEETSHESQQSLMVVQRPPSINILKVKIKESSLLAALQELPDFGWLL